MNEVDDRKPQKLGAPGLLENGLSAILMAVLATSLLKSFGVRADSIAAAFADIGLSTGLFLVFLQCCFEIFGRESVLLRKDWQSFSGYATGIALLSCGGAVLSCLWA